MVTHKWKYVHVFTDRFGRPRAYFRYKGRRIALPYDLESEDFARAYHDCKAKLLKAAAPLRSVPADGSLEALAIAYYKTPNFRDLSLATQKEYRRVIDRICKTEGAMRVARLEKRHVMEFRDRLGETPGAANTLVRVLSVLLSHSIDLGWRRDNPARGVKQFKVGEHRAWTDAEVSRFREFWPADTMQRRAMELALYTGQRRGDLAAMTKADVEGNAIRVIQSKTGVRVSIPMHQTLQAQLAILTKRTLFDRRRRAVAVTLLHTSEGKPFDNVYFGSWFKDAIRDAGLPDDCQLHGLRKTAARMLAEAGCTELKIMSITGRKTSRMVAAYTRDADQRMRANAAILKLERRNKT